MGTLLQDATIVTMNPQREVLEKADLLIEGDRIEKIFPEGRAHKREGDDILDCDGKIIIPGLISAHTHLTGMFQRGLWDETSFESWSRKSAATEKFFNLSADDIHVIHSAACIELIRHGVTAVLNMFTVPLKDPLKSVSSACQAFLDTGIRGTLALSLKDQSPDNTGMVPEINTVASWVSLAKEASTQVSSFGPRVSFALAPSAPQRCSDRLLIACREIAEDFNVGLHTHLAETRKHAEIGRKLYGEPIVHHLERIGFLSSALSAAHAVWLNNQEIDILKRHDIKIVHNPSSNMKLGSGVAHVKQMLNEGLAVGLGADSVNAGTIYSIFEQMKLSVLLPRSLWGVENWVLPSEAFAMGTEGGARALLLDGIIGSIEEGKKADLAILSPSISLVPNNDVINELALCENGGSVESVFIDGKPVMLGKKITGTDEKGILAKFSSMKSRIAGAKSNVLQNP
ncbi:MAG: amidohydrolase family protein [Candidatus Binatia bacterium]